VSDRDPTIHCLSQAFLIHSNSRLNPAVSSYAPGSQSRNNMASQVSAPPSSYLEARVSAGSLQKQKQDPAKAHHDAMKFKQELEQLSREVHADVVKGNGTATPKANSSLPQYLRTSSGAGGGTGSKSLPPHLRKKAADG
jgi:hypothetical protein